MLFDKLKKVVSQGKTIITENKPQDLINKALGVEAEAKHTVASKGKVTTPTGRVITVFPENDALVLWWISKKKQGYDLSTNKYPKWFENDYLIDFNTVARAYLSEGCLAKNGTVVTLTPEGRVALEKYDYIVYLHEHPYNIEAGEFTKAQNLHKVKNSDIAWGIFNKRILSYTSKQMWESLAINYSQMAHLLIEEKKYDQALDFVFATTYLETSGMKDKNELVYIFEDYSNKQNKYQLLDNGMPNIFLMEINNYHVTSLFNTINGVLHLEWDDIYKRFMGSKLIASLERLLPFRYFEKEDSFEFFKEAILANESKGIFRLADVSKKLKVNMPDEHSVLYFYASPENETKRHFQSKKK